MGAEQSTRRDPPYFLNANVLEAVPSQNSDVSQSSRRSSRPSVSDFSNNPEKYPDFVLVLVLSTGKMEVTRLQARSNAAKVKVVATPNDSGSSDNSSFFRRSSEDDTILYFDTTTGRLGTCKKEDQHRYMRDGLIWLW